MKVNGHLVWRSVIEVSIILLHAGHLNSVGSAAINRHQFPSKAFKMVTEENMTVVKVCWGCSVWSRDRSCFCYAAVKRWFRWRKVVITLWYSTFSETELILTGPAPEDADWKQRSVQETQAATLMCKHHEARRKVSESSLTNRSTLHTVKGNEAFRLLYPSTTAPNPLDLN